MKKVFLMSTVFCFLGAALLPAQEGKQGFFAELFPQAVLAFGDSDAVDSISLNDFRTHNKFASVGLDFKLWGFQFVVDLEVSQSLAGYASNAGWSNLPGFTPGSFSPMNFFINTPTLGFVEYSNDVFDVSVGRRRWAFGYGEYNMALSAQAPFYDGAWFALHPQTKDGNRWYYHFLLAGDDSKFVNDNLINQAPTSYARYIDDL